MTLGEMVALDCVDTVAPARYFFVEIAVPTRAALIMMFAVERA